MEHSPAPGELVDQRAGAGPDSSGRHALKRSLGTGAIIFMVLAAAAPLTATTGVLPLSILFSENSAAPLYFLVAVAVLGLFSVAYTAMSKTVQNAGAFYSYIEAGLGRTVGNAAAMLALGAYALTVLALTTYAGPFASQLANGYVGTWFADVINVLLLGSIFACALSFHNVVNRYQMTMSRAGVLPQRVGRIHHRYRVPSTASAVLSGLVFVALAVVAVIGLDPATQVFAPLVGILGFAVISLMSLASLSAVFYLRRQRSRASAFTTTVAPIGALIALIWVLSLSFSNIEIITGSATGSAIVISLMIAFPVIGAITSWVVRPGGGSSPAPEKAPAD